MSKLDAEFSACGASVACLGARLGGRDGEVVCSFESGAVEVYNIHDQSCMHSWQLPSSELLSLPVIYHEPSSCYWGIKNASELFHWSEDAVAIGDAFEVLPSEACDLLSCHMTSQPLVVCSDGTLAVGGVATTRVGGAARKTRRKKFLLRFSELLAGDGLTHHVCLYCTAASQYRLSVVAIGNHPEPDCLQELSDTALLNAAKPREMESACLCGETLLILWSTGELACCDLHQLLHTENNIKDSTIFSTRHSFSPPIRLQLASVSHDYFIIADVTSDQTTRLLLWDTAYHTCQAQTCLKFRKLKQVYCCHGSVVCVGGDGVRVCGVQLGRGGLSDALGMRESESVSTLAVVPEWVRPDQECAQWESKIMELNSQEQDYIASLSDRKKTPTKESFHSLLSSRWSQAPPISLVTTPTPVLQRVLLEEGFWPRKSLEQLVTAGLVPLPLSGAMAMRAGEIGDWSLVSSTLRHTVVPEDAVARLIVMAIDLPDELCCHGSVIKRDSILCQLLSQPYNDVLLQQPLSEVPFSHILLLLQFLNRYVTMEMLLSTSPAPPVSYDVILKWVWLLVDVHFTQLALCREARASLLSLQSRVCKQVVLLGRLSAVRSLCDAVKQQSSRAHSNGCLYKLEKIKLTV